MSIKAKMEVESQKRQKSLAVLVDPDKLSSGNKKRLVEACKKPNRLYILWWKFSSREEQIAS